MGWELLGGDPAPGYPDSVASAATAMQRVADLARDARTNLVQRTGAAGIESWKGTAADAFRDDVRKLPASLDLVHDSYQEASQALATFRTVLEQAQADARAALNWANQAKSDHDSAQAKLTAAEHELDDLQSQHRTAQAGLTRLQVQRAATVDPVQHSNLTSNVATARSRVNRLDGDITTARQRVAQYQGQVDAAESSMKKAVDKADGVRRTLSDAADRAVSALKQAERDAHLPSWLQERSSDARAWAEDAADWVTDHAELIKTVLSAVQAVCTFASMVFPFAAPVLMGISLGCGILILATDLIKDVDSGEGFSAANLFELGADFVGVVASAAGFGAATKLASAGKLAIAGDVAASTKAVSTARALQTTSTWVSRGQEGVDVVHDVVEGDYRGAAFAAGGAIVGEVGTRLGGKALTGLIGKANGSTTIRNQLTRMSRVDSVRNPTSHVVGVDVGDLPDTRSAQSLLGSGHIGPGGFLPGSHPAANPDLGHAVSQDVLDRYAEKAADPLWKEGSKDTAKVLDETLPGHREKGDELEIDIDLNPSQYGGTP